MVWLFLAYQSVNFVSIPKNTSLIELFLQCLRIKFID